MRSFWRAAFKFEYRVLAAIDPLVRAFWRRYGVGNVVELRVRSHGDANTTRSRLVGILATGGHWYIGHPNGDVGWTRDLRAAGEGVLIWPSGEEWNFSAALLPSGDERERAIRSTGQHPFPGNLIYRLGRRHVRRFGVYFRVEPISADTSEAETRNVGA